MLSALLSRRLAIVCYLSLIGSFLGEAQTISRLTDQVLHTHRSSLPDSFVNLTAEKVLFMATPSATGIKTPYVTDGSTAGTLPLLPSQSAGTIITGGFHVLGSHGYFFTYLIGSPTSSFWKTDGTPGGTTLVTDQAPIEVGAIQIVNGRVIGIAYDQEYSRNFLWSSNGTPQGTGTIFTPSANSSIYSGSAADGSYYFGLTNITDDGQRDAIWKSDGTAGGTVMVRTLSHVSEGATTYDHSPEHPTPLNGYIYFLAREIAVDGYGDYFNRSVLWRTDGTSMGTQRLGNFPVLYNRMFAFAGSLFMEKSGSVDGNGSVTPPQILRSNGTVAGSSVVFYGNHPRLYTSMQRVGEYGGHVYYNTAHYNVMYPASPRYSDLHRMLPDGSFESLGTLPTRWSYPSGEQLSYAYGAASHPSGFYIGIYGGVTDIRKITSSTPHTIESLGPGAVASNAMIGGYMIGSGNNFTTGSEVYSNKSGHTLIADLSPGISSSDASYSGFQGGVKASLGNLLLYNGQDPAGGTELWRSDGTPEGTFCLKDISTGTSSSAISSIFPANGSAWFVVQRGDMGSGSVTELWKTDGTNTGTTFIKRCPESETWSQFHADDNRIVVKKYPIEGTGYSLEILDGSGTGIVVSPSSGSFGTVILSGGSIWWQESGSEALLKRHDGTESPAQTAILPAGHNLLGLEAAYGNGVVCTTVSGGQYHVVWIRPSGSVILETKEGYSYFSSFTEHAGRLYFTDGSSLYASDGTANAAVMLHTAYQIGNPSAGGFISHQGALYFISKENNESPRAVWKTGGTPATTTVTPIQLPPGYSDAYFISNGDWLLYPYDYYDSTLGESIQQVRRSSGIADGEVIPGMTSADLAFYSSEKNLKPHSSGIVFFNRYTPENGDELYKLVLPAAPPTSPFETWAQSHGLSGNSARPNGDADNDGTPNLVEFYSGTAPDQRNSSVKPGFTLINSSGGPTQVISFPRMPGSGLTLYMETSVDMVNWNPDVTIWPDGTHSYSSPRRTSIHSREGSSPESITFAVTPDLTFQKLFVRFRVIE